VKYLKALGLAAIAAMALMAFLGAGSASATVLCTQALTTCPGGHETGEMYEPGDVIVGTSTNARLTSDLANVKCTNSETEAELESTGGASETVTGKIIELNFTGCKTEQLVPVNCTVTVNNLPYNAEVHWTEGRNGQLTVTSGGAGNPGATVVCIGVINCTFSNTLFSLPVDGGNPAKVTANKVNLLRNGGLCGNEAFWDATYESTTPVYVLKD
jgi:hypothetical protein